MHKKFCSLSTQKCVLCCSFYTSCIIEFFYDLFKNVPGEEVFNELLSYSCDTPVVSQVQGRHLEPGGRGGGALHAGPTVHSPGLVILNEIVLSLRVDFSNYEKFVSRAKFLDTSEDKSFTERVVLNCDDNLLVWICSQRLRVRLHL